MTQDHIIPRSKGGSSDLINLQPMCEKCNVKKSDALPWDAKRLAKHCNGKIKGNKIVGRIKVKVLDWSRLLSVVWWYRAMRFALKNWELPKMPHRWKCKKVEKRVMGNGDKQKEQWLKAVELLTKHFGNTPKALEWMNTDNPMLGNQVPMEMIVIGRGHKLLKFIKNSLEENKTP